MARQPRYLLNRNGRYFARLVIPKNLRPYLENRTELRKALGPDRRAALAQLHSAVATLQHEIDRAEQRRQQRCGDTALSGRYLLTSEQIAVRNYHERLSFDDELRNLGPLWSSIGIDDVYVADLRAGLAGKLNDRALGELIGGRIERYRRLGNTTVETGSENWRALARALCISELEALSRVAERDEGDFSGMPQHPVIKQGEPPVDDQPPIPLRELFNRNRCFAPTLPLA